MSDRYYVTELKREALATQAKHCHLVIACHDSWSSTISAEADILSQLQEVAWLPIYGEFGTVLIGPWTRSSVPGCFSCADHRRLSAVEDIETFRRVRERTENDDLLPTENWLTSWGLQVFLLGIEAEIEAILHTSSEAKEVQTARAILQLNLATLQWSRHRFLPDPLCFQCGYQPQDTRDAARIQLQSRQKPNPESFRVLSSNRMPDDLGESYIDAKYGLIHRLSKHTRGVHALMTAVAGVEYGERRRHLQGYGSTLNFTQSYLAAVAEALERYGGQHALGKRTAVRGTFRQLQAEALDPATLGLYTQEQYAQPNFGFVPYHQDLTYDWVWGYSFSQQRPLLVPEFYAYYGHLDEHAFVYECSNGCALGNCLEEAILYGMLEALERDAFLLAWYAQLGVPRLDISSIPSQRVRWLIERMAYSSGYAISVFNTTLLHGVACCWVMAVDEQQRAGFPRMICAAGSHLAAEAAILSALLELASTLPNEQPQEEWFRQQVRRARNMLDDPLSVVEMADHSTLYMLPEALTRLDFLMQSSRRETYQEAFAHLPLRDFSLDLAEDVSRLIDYYQGQGIDTIVVDQTTPEHRECGFHCVKIIMPGMLPMTFGHQYRRVSGFKRLAEWPALLGYRKEPLVDVDVNPYPHPFP